VKESWWATRKQRFEEWWRAPTTTPDRIKTALLSMWAGLWIGAIACVVLLPFPIPFSAILYWALAGAGAAAILGALFPKAMWLVAMPFAFLGIGSGNT
jgi:hypothetical protein